jgi:hypothetical protein
MYTRVNDIMRLDCGSGSSLDEGFLAVCLKALTSDQFLTKLVVPPAVYEPICMNQAARTTLLMVMPMLDDVDITVVQRGDLSHGVPIPGTDISGGLGSATDGRGGVVISGRGDGPAGDSPIGGRGSGTTGGSGSTRSRKNRCMSSSTTTKYHLM